jgi:penicillin-binding protein 1A
MAKKRRLKRGGKLKIWLISMAGVLLMSAIIFAGLVWSGFFGPVPAEKELEDIQNQRASEVLSAEGELLGTFYLQNRTEAKLEEISPILIDALLSIEDIRFYEHNGIDKRALARVFFRSILLGQDAGGGSTITQQLAKNLYPRERDGTLYLVADKLREMIIARRLEKLYTKDEILELYLNTVSFGEDVYGIEMASRRFFNLTPSELDIRQAATLTGMLRATSWYNPHRNPDSAFERGNLVIQQMEKYGKITVAEAQDALSKDLNTDYTLISTSEGPAPYFREFVRQKVSEILESESTAAGSKIYNLYTDGLTIHTTLRADVQRAARQAVDTQMRDLQSRFDGHTQNTSFFGDRDDPAVLNSWRQSEHYRQLVEDGATASEIDSVLYTPTKASLFTWNGYEEKTITPYDLQRHYLSFLNTGFLAMDPDNGHIIAWVGGINHRHYKYDHVLSRRQVGSAFKPFVYSTAIENGIKPCEYRRNILRTYEDYEEWTPQNASDEYGDRYSLQAALANSVNTITVDLMMDTGIEPVIETARNLAITSPIPAEPSIALGTAELSLMEMTTAYAAFLNGGIAPDPVFITAIYNSEGEKIYDAESNTNGKAEPTAAMSPETAATIVRMLKKAVDDGTGSSLKSRFGISHAIAGKTGTTQQFSDGWFMGLTPDMAFGTWVGGSLPRIRFRNEMGYSSQTALPIAGHFLNNIGKLGVNHPYSLRYTFYDEQLESPFDFTCSDIRDDRTRDKIIDFIRGREPDEARSTNTETKKEIFSRIKRLFNKDN